MPVKMFPKPVIQGNTAVAQIITVKVFRKKDVEIAHNKKSHHK
jgi:hypothetical protein